MKKFFLESSDFNEYPHYVHCTAFLVNGKLADFKVGSYQSSWERRTFRGGKIDNEIAEHLDDWDLTCEYKKILVADVDEHNQAFELLEMWLDCTFDTHKDINLNFMYDTRKIKGKIK